MPEPGVLAFTKPSYVIKESGYRALIPVARTGGADGHVGVKWRTKDITAVNGKDYKGGEGELKFDNQEITKTIDIPLFESNVSCWCLGEMEEQCTESQNSKLVILLSGGHLQYDTGRRCTCAGLWLGMSCYIYIYNLVQT